MTQRERKQGTRQQHSRLDSTRYPLFVLTLVLAVRAGSIHPLQKKNSKISKNRKHVPHLADGSVARWKLFIAVSLLRHIWHALAPAVSPADGR